MFNFKWFDPLRSYMIQYSWAAIHYYSVVKGISPEIQPESG